MNVKYEVYKSTYPLSYYEIGTIYSFYGKRENTNNLKIASEEEIQKYSHLLDQLESKDSNTAIKAVKARGEGSENNSEKIRYYGVVVDKERGEKYQQIVVMMSNYYDGNKLYLIQKYSVGLKETEAIKLDGEDLIPVSDHAEFRFEKNINDFGVTRITRTNNNENNGITGITRVSEDKVFAKGVTGITRAEDKNIFIHNSANHESADITGITRAESSVTGITRAKGDITGITRAKK